MWILLNSYFSSKSNMNTNKNSIYIFMSKKRGEQDFPVSFTHVNLRCLSSSSLPPHPSSVPGPSAPPRTTGKGVSQGPRCSPHLPLHTRGFSISDDETCIPTLLELNLPAISIAWQDGDVFTPKIYSSTEGSPHCLIFLQHRRLSPQA